MNQKNLRARNDLWELRKNNLQYEIYALFINTVMIVDLFRLLLGNSTPVTILRNVLYLGCFAYMVIHAFSRSKLTTVFIVTGVYGALAVIGYLMNTVLQGVILNGAALFLSRCLVGFYIAYTLHDYSLLLKKLRKYFVVVALYCLVYIFMRSRGVSYGEYMTFSYNILIMATVCVLSAIKKPRPLTVIASVVLIVILVVYGARGPIVCLVVSAAVYFLFWISKASTLKKVGGIAVFVMAGTVLINAQDWLIAILNVISPNSRTLRLINKDKLLELSGRNKYFSILTSKINENWLRPNGLYADRRILAIGFNDTGNLEGYYAHNIALELMIQFGAVLGILIMLLLVVLILVSLYKVFKRKDDSEAIVFSAFLSGMITLLLSSSYLVNERFWLFFGLVAAIFMQKALPSDEAREQQTETQASSVASSVPPRNSDS